MLFSCTIKTQNHTLPAVWHKILIQKFSSASAPSRQKFFKPCRDYAVAKIRKFPRFERTPIWNTRSMHDTAGPEIHLSLLCLSPSCGSHVCVPGQLHHPSCPVWWHQSMVSASEARRRWKQWQDVQGHRSLNGRIFSGCPWNVNFFSFIALFTVGSGLAQGW